VRYLREGEAQVLAADTVGKVRWTPLKAVTRRLPRNDNDTMYRVCLDSGHEEIFVEGQQLLVAKNGNLILVRVEDVVSQDLAAVAGKLPTVSQPFLDLSSVLRKTEFIFTDEMIDAKKTWEEDILWYRTGNFKSRLPYQRGDSIRVAALKTRPQLIQTPRMVAHRNSCTRKSDGLETMIPQDLALTRDFGFFVGAYLAEGCVCKFQVIIANITLEYREASKRWPMSLGVTSHDQVDKERYGTSYAVRFPC